MAFVKHIKLLILFTCLFSFGQELPPIVKFTTEDYFGDNQNWMISQGENNYVYVANNKGLLEYNGSEWVAYNLPKNTIIRAVNAIGSRIYAGYYGEFGYWTKNKYGALEYTSLRTKLDGDKFAQEQIWNIIAFKEWVIFQSNRNICFYNTQDESFKIIPFEDIVYKIFKIKHQIYIHVANEGVYVIEDGKPKLILSDDALKSERVINMFHQNDSLILITRNSGFFTFKNNTLTPRKTPADEELKTSTIFSCIRLRDGSFVLGTISDGAIHLSNNGELLYKITQKNGLGNNTVLSLFEDNTNNVWAGLDNGINCINVTSPIRTFFDYEGTLGTVYTTRVFKNTLYIGSNQGLFYRNLDATNGKFNVVEGTAGQVWDLYNHNNQVLFCGHHLGTFIIDKNKAVKISDELGAWTFKPIPGTDFILQGNYGGLYVLEQANGFWRVRNKIEGFKNSSRYFEINASHEVLVNHEYKGVFKLKLNNSLTKAIEVTKEDSLPLGKSSSLVRYKNRILYASENGVFEYDHVQKTSKKDAVLSNTIENNQYASGKLVVDENGRLWAFSKDNISYLDNDDVTNTPIVINIPIPSKLRKGVLGFENISFISNNIYVLGTANGYIKLDISKLNPKLDYTVHLNSVEILDFDNDITNYPINENAEFKHKGGTLLFKYSVPEYNKYLDVNYQYKLEGHSQKWSKWTKRPEITFENLSFGDYTFQVRAKIGNTLSNNVETYTFKVHRPWYLSNTAIIFYVLLLLIALFITNKAYKRHYIKKFKREQLEKEQMIMQMRNEKLNQDIESKNRELAISTMSIIKKNRVLNKIKKELKKNKQNGGDNTTAIQLIDSNLNDSKDWSFFEQAFNNADKDFLDKIKKAHPDLTPNDLRFCAYLRLNLSSKEMAPLLNISVKSVETKRYRLRKKLGLEHDSGLVNYILKF